MSQHTKKFQRRTEDFNCEACGSFVKGDGYTNHCSQCLTSRHVDVNPGDRQSSCGGLMPPVDIEVRKGTFRVVQRCVACGYVWRNRLSEQDLSAARRLLSDLKK